MTDNNPATDMADAIRSRLSDPFIGSFVIAFAFWHRKFFYCLASASGDAPKRINTAWKLFHHWGAGYDLTAVFAIALFYTLGWPYISGWIATARARIAVIGENRTIRVLAKARLETATTLTQRKEYKELDYQVNDLFGACEALWGLARQRLWPHGATQGFEWATLCDATGTQFPHLIVIDKSTNTARPLRGPAWANMDGLALGWRAVGATRLLYIRSAGMIPWAWNDAFTHCSFIDGAPQGFTVAPSAQPPAPLPMPRIDKAPQGLGVFQA
ncbi:MAG: hypothetical protein RL701_1914 [Pseudomonadota bacterium]